MTNTTLSLLRATQWTKFNRIKELRKLNGNMSQTDLGRLIGFGQGHIGRIEAGERGVSKETLMCIAKALRVNVKELFMPESMDIYNELFGGPPTRASQEAIEARFEVIERERGESTLMISHVKDDKIPVYLVTRDKAFTYLSTEPSTQFFARNTANYAIRMFDISMTPRISQGQMLLVSENEPNAHDIAVVIMNDNRVFIREWIGWDGDGNAITERLAPTRQEHSFLGEDVSKVHRVVAIEEPHS